MSAGHGSFNRGKRRTAIKVCIHRGSKEIGGNCVEIEAEGKRIVLDAGLPLEREKVSESELPPVKGFHKEDDSFLGLFISHPHLDHYGLLSRIAKPFLSISARRQTPYSRLPACFPLLVFAWSLQVSCKIEGH